jgi:hypothetical protein
MIGVPSSAVKPQTLGVNSNSSTYGQTIPVILGRAQGPVYLIWAANIRKGNSGKKGKAAGGSKKSKGTPPSYVANADALIGTNPIVGVLECWNNNQAKLALTFTSYVHNSPGDLSFTIPDDLFLAVLGITFTLPYSYSFNDYGGPGPLSGSGVWEVPAWNYAFARPGTYDPLPYFIRWTPGSGATLYQDTGPSGATAINVYYARMLPGGDNISSADENGPTPLAALRLTFEDVLGNGPEFTSTFAAQKILYPHYAGVGSQNFDLGSSGLSPQMRLEILGSCPVYPSGDADFADMVADIFGRAQIQAGWTAVNPTSPVQHALACYDFPGPVYSKFYQFSNYPFDLSGPLVMTYDQANTAGNFLVAFVNSQSGGPPAISSEPSLAWTPVFSSGAVPYQVWYATAPASVTGVGVKVSITGTGVYVEAGIMEIGGVDTLDAVAVGTDSATITTSNPGGTPGFMLGFMAYLGNEFSSPGDSPHVGSNQQWNLFSGFGSEFLLQTRIIHSPGTFTLANAAGAPDAMAILAFKCSQPPSYPFSLPNILDSPSLLNTREQCRAAGLFGSMNMNSQKAASDWLKELYECMNAAPVWSGFKLKSIPYSEVSSARNGAIYTAPTASGPRAVLTLDDFVNKPGEPAISCQRKAQVDVPNLLQIQCANRASDYNQVVVSQPATGAIAMYGTRKDSPVTYDCIQDVSVARMVMDIQIRRRDAERNVLSFTLKAKWKLLEPMDLLTLPADPVTGDPAVDVRINSIEEDENYNLKCDAKPFVYGVCAPAAVSLTNPTPFSAATNTEPASVNAPVIFEPIARLANGVAELWIAVSDPDPNYGGCQVLLSTDGGLSYNSAGLLQGNAITGVTTADWPAAADPDTVNPLMVDLTESLGALASYQTADQNNFTYPCYVAGGSGACPYELLSYAIATLTAANKYTLPTPLRRAVFGAPVAGAGVDHPSGSRFAFLSPDSTGILKLALDPRWIGQTLYFKFCAYNSFGNGLQPQSEATPYSYTVAGTDAANNPNSQNYTQTPALALSNPSPTQIDMAAVKTAFGTNTVAYDARTFTIPMPSVPTIYYVTIADPGYVGDNGSANLTATCQTSDALTGVPGNTYIGSVQALPAGSGTLLGAGGWPQSAGFLVNGS